MTLAVDDVPAPAPRADVMLLGRPVRPETLIGLGSTLAHHVGGRCLRVVHHTLTHAVVSESTAAIVPLIGASPSGDAVTSSTVWTLSRHASSLAIAVRYQGGRGGSVNLALISANLYRRSDEALIGSTLWGVGELFADPNEGGTFPPRWVSLDALDVSAAAGDGVELVVAGSNVRLLTVSAWEVWPETVG